jgi:hypothetical protein
VAAPTRDPAFFISPREAFTFAVMERPAKFRGGLRNGRGSATWPFATMLVTSDHVTLRSPLGGAVITAGSTWHAQRWRGLTAEGVRFTDERSLSRPLTFWTTRLQDVVAALESCGWHVEEFPEPAER